MFTSARNFLNSAINSPVANIIGVSLIVAGLTVGAKEMGWFEQAELDTYDRAVRFKPSQPPDSRIAIVKITEADLKMGWPIVDRQIAKLIKTLADSEAAIIGLDLFRPMPVPPGTADLVKVWQESPVAPGCHHLNLKNPGVSGPPGVAAEQLGFVDILVDRDSVARRALLFIQRPPNSPCPSEIALSVLLAEQYLVLQQGKSPERIGFSQHRNQEKIYGIDGIEFPRLKGNSGSYQNAEADGYQILLDYRSPQNVAPSMTMGAVLAGRVPKSEIAGKLILIGSTASSLKDEFLTPYSAGVARDANMPGVMVHAQIASQILSHVLDRRPLWWFMPDWLEALGIVGWCAAGGTIAWYVRHPGRLLLIVVGACVLTIGGWVLAFINMGWLPLISPLVGLVGSSIGILGWTSYLTQQEQKNMAALAQTQQETISALKLQLLLSAAPLAPLVDPNQTVPYPETTLKLQSGAVPLEDLDATYIPASLSPTPALPTLINDRYQIDRVLGSGGFGITYLARDLDSPGQPLCAIKQLKPARRDPNFIILARRLFDTEAQIMSKLGDHPQIPKLLNYFVRESEFYLVQEYIEGTTLDRVLAERNAPWSEAEVISLLRQLLPVLDFIHAQYVIHRDLKPANIICSSNGKLTIIDFGAVKEINPQLASVNPTIAIGTRGYTPPEQYAGKPTIGSDIYALGTIAIEALTNYPPRDLPIDDTTGNLIWRDLVDVSSEFADLLDRTIAYNFIDRYSSAAAVLADLPT